MSEPILVAKAANQSICLLPKMGNRHGLIAGATGTGKTVTLQTIAEAFSARGVSVFMADVKGDLAGMSQPTVMTPWAALFHMGLQRVVCLSKEPPNYKADPLIIAGHFPLQDLYGGITPDNPKSEQTLIYEASEIISSFIQASIGIVVHCAGGTGRTRTVIGCALRMLGYNSNEILPYLDRLKRMRGARRGRPESKW